MSLMDYQIVFLTMAGLLGLCAGSFLNVVIYRIPIMLDRESKRIKPPSRFNLAFPRSHCPHCKAQIPFWHNIPLFSYIILRGKSHCCGEKIGLRYPLTEILCTLLTIYMAYQFGFTLKTLLGMLLAWSLIALVFIDIEHMILPDKITIPMIWIGLIANTQNMFTSANSAILGAVIGYCTFWIIATVFKRIRGIDGLGGGDHKLLAMLGACLGWELLPFILLFSSASGVAVGMTYNILMRRKSTDPIPFGPFLALGGLITLFWGYKLVQFTIKSMV